MDRDTLVHNIRAGMEKRGWSGRRLSDEAGLNESAVKNIFNERSNYPRVDTVFKIAQALGKTVGELIGESPHQLHPNCESLLESFHQMNSENRARLTEVAATWARSPVIEPGTAIEATDDTGQVLYRGPERRMRGSDAGYCGPERRNAAHVRRL